MKREMMFNNTECKVFESRAEISSEQLERLFKSAKKTYPQMEPICFLRDKLTVYADDSECFVALLAYKGKEKYAVVSVNEKGSFFWGKYNLTFNRSLEAIKEKMCDLI